MKIDFRGENFCGLLTFATPKDATPTNFMEKTFAYSHKTTKFAKVFRYTVYAASQPVVSFRKEFYNMNSPSTSPGESWEL